jgi:hypothetical protein
MKISKARLLVIIKEIAERTIIENDEFDDLMATDLKIPVYYVWESSYDDLSEGEMTISAFEDDIEVDTITDVSISRFIEYLEEASCPEYITAEIIPSAEEAIDPAERFHDEDEEDDMGNIRVTIWVYPPNLQRSAEAGGPINEWSYGMATSD